MKSIIKLAALLFCALYMACGNKHSTQDTNKSDEIIFIAHTRTDKIGQAPKILDSIDFSQYAVRCLGGDLDQSTSSGKKTMNLWDKHFQFNDPNTLWALGNHDDKNRTLIEDYTGRPSYYAYTKDKVTYLVLDTDLDEANIIDDQLRLLKSVCDTISHSNSLVVLTHKLIWMPGHPELVHQIDSVSNLSYGDCLYCLHDNNFYEAVYPHLLHVKNKGIQVLCLAGDIGHRTQQFEYTTDEGIVFLASGMNTKKMGHTVLLLFYERGEGLLSWRFWSLEG